MAQFAPLESRCRMSADSYSMCGVEDVVGDMVTKHDDKDKEAEDRAEDNVDDADEETALVLERVFSLGLGPITCRNQQG